MSTVIVYGPESSGKTSNAEALCKMYGCDGVNDQGKVLNANFRIKQNHLNLVIDPPAVVQSGVKLVSIFDALKQLKEGY